MHDVLRNAIHLARHVRRFRRYRAQRTHGRGEYSLAPFYQHQCVFVHIPKTGGVSVAKALFGNLGWGHASVSGYKTILGPMTYRRYFSFTFVRNPYDRLVSAFTYLKSGGLTEADRAFCEEHLAPYDSVDDFIRGWLNEENARKVPHFRPQTDFLVDRGGEPEVDFIGRYENLEQDFAFVAGRLGIEAKLEHLNRGPMFASHYSQYYTPESKAIVATVYRRDFEILGYAV